MPFICPLYALDTFGTPFLQGSSVLLQVGGLHLLVTAAHVLRDAGSIPFIAGPTLQVEPLKYVREVAEEKWDFAILELHDEGVKAMANFSFWQAEYCDPNDVAARGHLYAFIGFPGSRNKTKYSAKFIKRGAFAYAEGPVSTSVYRAMKVQEQGSLLVNFDRNKVVGAEGKIETAPDLHGMSGGGAWRIDRVGAEGCEGASLVGICVQQHPEKKSLEAVRIGLVLETIRRIYPSDAQAIPVSQRFNPNVEIQGEVQAPNPEPQADD